MAWYDYYYNCTLMPLKRGKYSFTGLFKPNVNKKSVCKEENTRRKALIYWSHILLIVPLLGYISYYGNKAHESSFVLLGALIVFTLLYHSLKVMELSH